MSESESHMALNTNPDRDDEANPVTPGPATSGMNLESSTKELAGQGITSAEGTTSRARGTEPTPNADQQQPRVQFTPANNYFKNVSDNKDVAKLVSLLVTCINATKKVESILVLSV